VAAALLFLGVAAGVANLDVRYNSDGLTVRTGWSRSAAPSNAARDASVNTPRQASAPPAASEPAPWRADLAAVEQELRQEFRASVVPGAARPVNASAAGVNEADLLRRVRTMIAESERQQQTELALRLAGLIRDVNAQRNADLVRINQNLGLLQQDMGIAVLKNTQKVDYLIRASQAR
jgi:hypothetical protein